jgi:iron complex outermembrane receptor protein
LNRSLTNQLFQARDIRQWLVFCTLCCFFSFSSIPVRASSLDEPLQYFDIPAQRADLAIVNLAQQSHKTLIFPTTIAKQIQANSVKGFYTFSMALHKLLYDTGLSVSFDAQGQPIISQSPMNTALNMTKKIAVPMTSQSVEQEPSIEKIAIVGNRNLARSVDDLPVPVDMLSHDLLVNTGQSTLGRQIQTVAPSFNFPTSVISDGTDALNPATLRGLGPDQTLVLINGKRRHQASLIHINTSVGRGTTSTDFTAIPTNAIKHIEILRDGASAQYGSDAIAGVINIVLADEAQNNSLSTSFGETSAGDGMQSSLQLNHGLVLAETGFINTSISLRHQTATNRAGLHGSCLYPNCQTIGENHWRTHDPREIMADRHTFKVGSPASTQLAAVINAELPVNRHTFYTTITYSNRNNETAAFFRENANRIANPTLNDGEATIVEGYLPKIESYIDDYSATLGMNWLDDDDNQLDISYSYGLNRIDYETHNSINASYAVYLQQHTSLSATEIRQQIPRQAYAYGLRLSQNNLNFDGQLALSLGNWPVALSYGGEIRQEHYRVLPGEPYSYLNYVEAEPFFSLLPPPNLLLPDDEVDPGIQGFPGIAPISAVDETRSIYGIYLEGESEVTDDLLVNLATRLDHYQHFESSLTYKLAFNYLWSETLTLRGAINTGFRAPSIQQLYFNNISTQFVVDHEGELIPEQIGTFRNDSKLTATLGIPTLKQEQSKNFSLGAIIHWQDIKLTVDYYAIAIDDRIVISNRLGKGLSKELDQALADAGASKAQFFLNGVDTITRGIDIVATWQHQLANATIDVTLAANHTNTHIDRLFTPTDSELTTVPIDAVFSTQDMSIIESWQPKNRISLNALYQRQNWQLSVNLNRYGNYTVVDGGSQTYSAKWLADFKLNYQLAEHLNVFLGLNNVFNTTPDKNRIGNARAGILEDNEGHVIVQSDGVFQYSRRSAPFGFNGQFGYVGIDYQF